MLGVSFSVLSSPRTGDVTEVAALTFKSHSVSKNMKFSNKLSEVQEYLRRSNRHVNLYSGESLTGLCSGDLGLLGNLFSRFWRRHLTTL